MPLEAPRIGSPELPELLDFAGTDAAFQFIKPNESIPAGIHNHDRATTERRANYLSRDKYGVGVGHLCV